MLPLCICWIRYNIAGTMTDELEIERAAAVEMRRHGLFTSVVTGFYSAVLSGGALYIQHRDTVEELEPPVVVDPVNYVLSSQMASKVSFSYFPAFVLGCLSYAVYVARPQIGAADKLDPVSISSVQRTCKALLDRVNMTRMFTNIFAVLFVWRMSSFQKQLGRKDDAATWFTYALCMAGLGLICGLSNTLLHFRMTKSYRELAKSIHRRFRRPY